MLLLLVSEQIVRSTCSISLVCMSKFSNSSVG
uniref:Uncharacterized protein n=1 Tax=Arundo donax TaxID=35708 RepID=A0A0A9EWT2_ARUDO